MDSILYVLVNTHERWTLLKGQRPRWFGHIKAEETKESPGRTDCFNKATHGHGPTQVTERVRGRDLPSPACWAKLPWSRSPVLNGVLSRQKEVTQTTVLITKEQITQAPEPRPSLWLRSSLPGAPSAQRQVRQELNAGLSQNQVTTPTHSSGQAKTSNSSPRKPTK